MSDLPTRARLEDVARVAGVSVSTASRVVANRGEISVATRMKVLRAIDEVGYDRLSTRRGRPSAVDPRAIEFVCGLFGDYWADEAIAGARHMALSSGLDLMMTMERRRPEDDWPVRVATRRPAGVVLAIISPTTAQLDAMRNLNVPLALLEPPSEPPPDIPSVSAAMREGGYAAGAHLIECGYERFVIARGQPRMRFGRAREDGFRAAVRELGGDIEIDTVDSEWNGRGVQESLLGDLINRPGRVGVFAYNDDIALVVCEVARQAGARIPEDVGVVGVDGSVRGAGATPPLTTIRQPLRQMAARAVELVLQQRDQHPSGAIREELDTDLVIRGSTAPV